MPVIEARIETADGLSSDYTLRAFDPMRNIDPAGVVSLVWINTEEDLAQMQRAEPPPLHIISPDKSVDLAAPISTTVARDPDAAFIPIAGTDYSYRVRDVMLNQTINENVVSVAFVEMKRGEELFNRWAFDDPSFNRDFAPGGSMGRGGELDFDDAIHIAFLPGQLPPAQITITCGPNPSDLPALVTAELNDIAIHEITPGEKIALGNGVFLPVMRPGATIRTRPR